MVRLIQLDANGDPLCSSGSGTVVGTDGLILTNFHVVENRVGTDCEYSALGVAVTEDVEEPPTLSYLADVYAIDPTTDLAVARIASDLEGGENYDADLPAMPLGDSDAVRFGDQIRVFGYPGIGGETITFTEGQVSGFNSSPDVEGRAWIKTATTIAGGNSGGSAVDDAGRLVGIPTIAAAGDDVDSADCRLVADTNGDGVINRDDTCIPIGGFLNGLRPVNLAETLLETARTAPAIPVDELTPEPVPTDVPAADPFIGRFTFASGVDESNQPTEVVAALPSRASDLCAFFDYEGMVPGAPWDALWTVDGVLNEDVSLRGNRWRGATEGSWWVCARGADTGLADGLWELSVFVGEEEPVRSDSIFIGDAYAPVDIRIVNGLDVDVCYLYVSPVSSSRWGADELADSILDPGEDVTITVGAEEYDVQGRSCEREELVRMRVDMSVPRTVVLEEGS